MAISVKGYARAGKMIRRWLLLYLKLVPVPDSQIIKTLIFATEVGAIDCWRREWDLPPKAASTFWKNCAQVPLL
jgi:hypothetical protein